MENTNIAHGGPFSTASVDVAANHASQGPSAGTNEGVHQQHNNPQPTGCDFAAGTSAAPAPSTAAGTAAPHSSTLGSNAVAAVAGEAATLPPINVTVVAPHPPAANLSIWSNFAAAAADPAFFNHLSSMMVQHQQQQTQQPGFNPLSTGFNTHMDHTAPLPTFAGAAVKTTTAAAMSTAGSHFNHLDSMPGSPTFPHSPLTGSLSNAAAAAAAALSNTSLGTSSCSEGFDKCCSHCGKVEQRQWRKRGDGTLLCNRCFMWRRNHGGIALPPLDPAPMQPAITKQHSVSPRASSSSGGDSASHGRHARHSNPGTHRVLQELAGLQDSDQEMSHGSRHASGSYSAPASPVRPRSRSASGASSPARRRRAGSPDDPEYRPRASSKLSRSTSASGDHSAAAAAAVGARSSSAGHTKQNQHQQHSKLRPRSRLARAGGSGAWEDEEDAGMGHASDRSAAGRQLQHQGSSIRSRLAASAAAAAAAAAATEESDEEVVSAAEVLAGLLPMGCYDSDEYYAEQQEADTPNAHELLAAAAAPPPTSTAAAAHQGGHMNTQVADQSMEEMTGNMKADGVVRLQRSGKGTASCKTAAPPSPCKDQLMSQQQGCMSPAATAKAEQARAAAAAGTINPHVCQAILAALAAGAAAESIDLASTQRKFEVMEQQLHVPHLPAAAHLLSRMSGRSS